MNKKVENINVYGPADSTVDNLIAWLEDIKARNSGEYRLQISNYTIDKYGECAGNGWFDIADFDFNIARATEVKNEKDSK